MTGLLHLCADKMCAAAAGAVSLQVAVKDLLNRLGSGNLKHEDDTGATPLSAGEPLSGP